MANRIIFTEPGVTLLQPFDVRDPGPTDVVIETAFSLMSIGTELTILHRRYADNSHFARIFSFPQLKTGVQASGRVIATGEDVENVQTGDRVFVRMAHGSHQVCDESECTPIPESVNLDDACWCGLGKTAFRAAWLAESGDESRVLVVGAGPLGQMLVRWLLAMKKDVIVADMSAQRLDYANAAGNVRTVAGDLHDSLATLKHSNSDGFPK